MKKFISALSSFVIAATAMGGTMAVSTSAADATETIVALRSNGKNEIQVNAGDTVPVDVYIPQSSGFNRLQMKFAIGKDGNLDDTKGKGTVVDRKNNEIKNYKDAFGFYGIKMTAKGDKIGSKQTDFTYPNCLESGKELDDYFFAGDIANTGIAMFNTDDGAWSILYQAKPEIEGGKDVDCYGAWVKAGGVLDEEFDYSNYTPVTTWTKDSDWSYKYTFTKFELQLPSDLPDGTYVLDVYKDEYVNCHPGSLFRDDNTPVPDNEREVGQTNFKGVNGEQKWSSEKLTIKVGNGSSTPTTTEPQQTPTTTEPQQTPVSGDTIVYNLIPHGKEYTAASGAGKNNVYNATAGEELTVDWTIKNDLGTAGLQMNFDFTQVEYVSGKRGSAYRIVPTFSDYKSTTNLKKGECIYTWAQSEENKADDDAVIYAFNVKVPETAGTYSVGMAPPTADTANKAVPIDQTKEHKFDFHGLDIVVGGSTPGTTEPGQNPTTTQNVQQPDAKTIIYNLIPSGKEYKSAQENGLENNVYNATAGEDLKIDWTIKNDQGTAGLQMNFDFTQVEYVSGKRGSAYRIVPTYSDFASTTNLKKGECIYTWAQSEENKANDDSVIYSFNVKVPEAAGTYSVGMAPPTADTANKAVPIDQTKEHKFVFYGLDIVVGGSTPVTTAAPETTPAPETTTAPAETQPIETQPPVDTTAAPVVTTENENPTVLYGDVNCDGDVRINDVVLLNKYLARSEQITKQGLLNADCEKDDKVDAKDATKIKQFLALLIERSELGKKSN